MLKYVYFLSFHLFLFLGCSYTFATQPLDPENGAIILAPRHSTGSPQAMREYPYTVESTNGPLCKISLNGTSLSFLYLGEVNHPINVESFWSYVDTRMSAAPQFNPEERNSMRGNLILFPLTPQPLMRCRHECNLLTSRMIIEANANPDFYSISYQEIPINLFILPTVHSVPFDALPSYLKKWIHAIARTKDSKVILEVGPDFFCDDDEDQEDSLGKLNIETCVQRDFENFVQHNTQFFQHLPEFWIRTQQEEKEKLDKIYKEGWTKSLDPECQKVLPLGDVDAEFLDRHDPHYVYHRLNSILQTVTAGLKADPQIVMQLDDCIREIFSRYQKQVIGLDTEDLRNDAHRERAAAEQQKCTFLFETNKILVEGCLKKFALFGDDLFQDDTKKRTLYYKTLDDLQFNCPYQMAFFMGRLPEIVKEDVEVDVRNKEWWSQTIEPLLDKQANLKHNPPALMVYGAGHNTGPFSIIELIRKKEGFEVHKVERPQKR